MHNPDSEEMVWANSSFFPSAQSALSEWKSAHSELMYCSPQPGINGSEGFFFSSKRYGSHESAIVRASDGHGMDCIDLVPAI